MIPDTLMIFAAGFGTRMGALTREKPKPLIEVAGVPLIDRAIGLGRDAGVSQKIVNTHYLGEQLARHLGNQTGIMISHEEPEALETGGGLKRAAPLIGAKTVFTLNPDVVWAGKNPLTALLKHWNPAVMDALLMLVPCRDETAHTSGGDFDLDDAHRVTRAGATSTRALIYSGAQIIKTAPVANTGGNRFSLNIVWDQLIEKGRVFGCVHDGGWVDVGTPAGIQAAETMLRKQTDV